MRSANFARYIQKQNSVIKSMRIDFCRQNRSCRWTHDLDFYFRTLLSPVLDNICDVLLPLWTSAEITWHSKPAFSRSKAHFLLHTGNPNKTNFDRIQQSNKKSKRGEKIRESFFLFFTFVLSSANLPSLWRFFLTEKFQNSIFAMFEIFTKKFVKLRSALLS